MLAAILAILRPGEKGSWSRMFGGAFALGAFRRCNLAGRLPRAEILHPSLVTLKPSQQMSSIVMCRMSL
jgi:hypothetical protein